MSLHDSEVRDVVICGGAPGLNQNQLQEFLHCHPQAYLIGVDGGNLALLQSDLPYIDLALGDFDSVTQEQFEAIQAKSKRMQRYQTEKDDTDMELALEVASQMQAKGEVAVTIFGGIGGQPGRLDHLLANLWMLMEDRFANLLGRLTFVEEKVIIKQFGPGKYCLEDLNQSHYLSIISMTPVRQLRIEGAKYNLPATDFAFPRALISNEYLPNDTMIHMGFDQGIVMVLWVIED